MVHADSSKAAAGIFCAGDWSYLHWKMDYPDIYPLHINYKEVMAVLLAANRWAPLWQNADVTVVTDSMVAKCIINKGTCKQEQVMGCLRRLFWLQVQYNFRLNAIHIPGCLNQIPDSISRLHEPGQILRLQSLLNHWHQLSGHKIIWDNHMSHAALQVVLPLIRRWRSRLSWTWKSPNTDQRPLQRVLNVHTHPSCGHISPSASYWISRQCLQQTM